ncbi:MAG: hypothetical protein M1835_007478 [Candelina submexicana]|nr:MAG: hypothetical protein M1835_007478 [Candelina submexicana]
MVQPSTTASKARKKGEKKKPSNDHAAQRNTVKHSGAKYSHESHIPIELQQLLLNIFNNSFRPILSRNLAGSLQEIKQHLYDRDFHKAFGSEVYRKTYASRWSPTRALGYLTILVDLQEQLLVTQEISDGTRSSVGVRLNHPIRSTGEDPKVSLEDNDQEAQSLVMKRPRKILCLGGGAGAEIVALAGFLRHLQAASARLEPESSGATTRNSLPSNCTSPAEIAVTAVDIADWSMVVEALHKGVTTTPSLPKYGSSSVKAANQPLVAAEALSVTFEQLDVLSLCSNEVARLSKETDIVTLMFTLNELYATSMAKTTQLLLSLTAHMGQGTLLLVVDSPGSYSTVSLGTSSGVSAFPLETKKYPMQWLLDHTLLGTTAKSGDKGRQENPQWERLFKDESRWFRLPQGLKYPLELENMRYQIHMYRRL